MNKVCFNLTAVLHSPTPFIVSVLLYNIRGVEGALEGRPRLV